MTPREFAISVVQRLQAAGFQALWAGGCVRDQLMGKQPKDYDVATDAEPTQVRNLFGHKKTIPIGAAFGVITVLGPKPAGAIEVATFRRDTQYSDGRHPDAVVFSSPEEDANRRDFTINGMFYDPIKQYVIDYVGGQADLQQQIIRAIGNPLDRIQEDKLRMLRGVRFAATFGFHLERETLQAIQSAAHQLSQISPERIGNELTRMLTDQSRARACQLLVESRLIAQVLPVGWFDPQEWEGSSFEQRLLELQRLSIAEFASAAFVMLRRTLERLTVSGAMKEPPPASEAVASPMLSQPSPKISLGQALAILQDKWRLTNQQTEQIDWIARHWKLLGSADLLPWSKLQRLLIHPTARLGMAVTASILGTTSGLKHCDVCLAWPIEKLDPPWLVDGQALIRLGLRPGPQFKAILQDLRNRQLDGELLTPDQAHAFVRTHYLRNQPRQT